MPVVLVRMRVVGAVPGLGGRGAGECEGRYSGQRCELLHRDRLPSLLSDGGSVRALRSRFQWDIGRRTGHMLRPVRRAALVAGIAVLAAATSAHGAPLANRCFAMTSPVSGHSYGRFYVKPTGPATLLLYDRGRRLLSVGSGSSTARTTTPGPPAEWASRRSGRFLVLRSTSSGRVLAASGRKLVTVPAG